MKAFIESSKAFLKNNLVTICVLALIALTAYGYELFNIHITIDEENAALRSSITLGFIEQGRVGAYVISRLLLPKQVIPSSRSR